MKLTLEILRFYPEKDEHPYYQQYTSIILNTPQQGNQPKTGTLGAASMGIVGACWAKLRASVP